MVPGVDFSQNGSARTGFRSPIVLLLMNDEVCTLNEAVAIMHEHHR